MKSEDSPLFQLIENTKKEHLKEWIYSVRVEHTEALKKVLINHSQSLFNSLNEQLQVVVEEEGSTFRKQSEIDRVQGVIYEMLQKDIDIIEQILNNTSKLQQESEHTNKLHQVVGSKSLDKELMKSLMSKIEELKEEVAIGKKLKREKDLIEVKYEELNANLCEISEAMSLLEETNRDLLRKTEKLEHINRKLIKKSLNTKRRMQAKNTALHKAQLIIKQLSHTTSGKKCENKGVITDEIEKMNREMVTEKFISEEEVKLINEVTELNEKIKQLKDDIRTQCLENNTLKEQIHKLHTEHESRLEASRSVGSKMNINEKKSELKDSLVFSISEAKSVIVTTHNRSNSNNKQIENLVSEHTTIIKDPLVPLLISELINVNKAVIPSDNALMEKEICGALSEALKMNEEYESQVQFFKKCIQAKNAIINKINEENNRLKKEVEDLSMSSNELVNKITSENEMLKENYKQLQESINNIKREESQKANVNFNEENKVIEELSKALNEAELEFTSFKDLTLKLKAARTTEEKLSKEAQDKELVIEGLKKRMKDQNNNYEAEIKALKSNIKTLSEEKTSLMNIRTVLQNALDKQCDAVGYYKGIIEQKGIHYTMINNYETEINNLRASLEMSQRAYNVIIQRLQEKEYQLNTLNEAIIQSNEEVNGLKKTLANKDTRIQQLEERREVKEVCEEYEKMKEELMESEKAQAGYKHKLQRRVKELDIIMQHIENLLCEVEDTKEVRDYITKIVSHSEELKNWLDNITAMIKNYNTSKLQHSNLLSELLKLIENSTHKPKIPLEQIKPDIIEKEKIIMKELQYYFKIHTKCYIPRNYQC